MDIESYTPRALTIATIYQPNRFDSSHNEHTTTVIRTLIPRYSFVNETSNLIVSSNCVLNCLRAGLRFEPKIFRLFELYEWSF